MSEKHSEKKFIFYRGEKVYGTKKELDTLRKKIEEELNKPQICHCGSGLIMSCDCGCDKCAHCNDVEFDLFD